MKTPRLKKARNLLLKNVNTGQLSNKQWQPLFRNWVIQAPLDKLKAKYKAGPTLIFDHYVFNLPLREPNKLLAADMCAADSLMSAQISANYDAWIKRGAGMTFVHFTPKEDERCGLKPSPVDVGASYAISDDGVIIKRE